MIAPKYLPLVVKQLARHPVRAGLTIVGVTLAMFLFITVQALHEGVREATSTTAGDSTLVVYRQNRFCPATSRLPEHYLTRIAEVPGVRSVTPIKVVVNNCRAALDVVTFRGAPEPALRAGDGLAADWIYLQGSLERWAEHSDAALVGEALARRRGLSAGDVFSASGVTVTIAGVVRSPHPQDQNVAYVHLNYLQRATPGKGGGPGVVTQYTVRVAPDADLAQVADAIDRRFRNDPDPTTTRPEKAFVAQAGADLVEIVGFTRWLGWGCLAAVLALVGNAVVLSVQDRLKEHAVLQTLGFRAALITRLIVTEGLLLGLIGGAAGTLLSILVIHAAGVSLSQEGMSIPIAASGRSAVVGLLTSASVGIAAGLVPALRAERREIAGCFRAV